jgi:hypothetical protein
MANNYQTEASRENLILGDELLVYAMVGSDWIPVGFSTSCSLNITAETIDTSNKFSGVWSSALPGKISWSISTESLMSYAETGYQYFFEKLTNREAFTLRFGQVKSAEEQDFDLNENKTYYSGKAYCTQCNLSADNGGIASMSIEFVGEGKLEKITAQE